MAVYRCRFCGSIYDEEKEGVPVSDLKVCPVCMVTADKLVRAEDGTGGGKNRTGRRRSPLKSRKHGKHAKTAAAVLRKLSPMTLNMPGLRPTLAIWTRFTRWP